jgi:hypothetical protein
MRYAKLTEQEVYHVRSIADVLDADYIISSHGLNFIYDEPFEYPEAVLYCLSLYLLEHIKAHYDDEKVTEIVSRANLKIELSKLTPQQKTDFYELVQLCIYEERY